MSFTWTTTPADAWSNLSAAQAAALPPQVIAIAVKYLSEIDKYLNAQVPWHVNAKPDLSGNEPEDLMSWVEFDPPSLITVYMSHGAMETPEKTMKDELAFIPLGVDHFGPQIMRDIQAMLRSI